MDSKEIVNRYKKELNRLSKRITILEDRVASSIEQVTQANKDNDNLSREKEFAARILNKIREALITRTDWNGVFGKGEDLGDILLELIEKGFVKPRGI